MYSKGPYRSHTAAQPARIWFDIARFGAAYQRTTTTTITTGHIACTAARTVPLARAPAAAIIRSMSCDTSAYAIECVCVCERARASHR